jgi:formylglycine-generating enzyme required for sulfatase activity
MGAVSTGEFFMGCNKSVDTECDSDEATSRPNLSAFWIDKTEVTVAEYTKCVDKGKCSLPNTKGLCTWGKAGEGQHPINCVDWNQAKAFCEWAGKRLPNEAEWEKAARGTDGRRYPWGNEWEARRANVDGETDGYKETAPVGSFATGASPYGALDMAGNVWEWTADWYDEGQEYRAVRGGSWNSLPQVARASNRDRYEPGHRHVFIGFRCAQ